MITKYWQKHRLILINDIGRLKYNCIIKMDVHGREYLIKKELQQTTNYVLYNGWSNRTTYGYHSFNIDEINIIGQRVPKIRIEMMKAYVDFTDKTIVDFGCNVGAMLFHIPEIKYGIGFDYDARCIIAARRIKKILNYENVDFDFFDFNIADFGALKDKITIKPDIAFVLSLGSWVKNIFNILQLCIEMGVDVILETNNDKEGRKEIEYFSKNNYDITLIIDGSPDDITQNKMNRKTYLISKIKKCTD